MKLLARRRAVRTAQADVAACHAACMAPARRLVARARRHPWISLGLATGAGVLLGRLRGRLPRAPGASSLLHAGVLELATTLLQAAMAPRAKDDQATPPAGQA